MYSYCYVCSILCILFHCFVLYMVCMSMCTVLLPPGVNPITVNKYIKSYHINKCCKIHANVCAFVNVETSAIQGQWHYHSQISHHNIAFLSYVFILTILLSVVFCLVTAMFCLVTAMFCLVTAMHKFDTSLVMKQTVKKLKLWKLIFFIESISFLHKLCLDIKKPYPITQGQSKAWVMFSTLTEPFKREQFSNTYCSLPYPFSQGQSFTPE
jgi:hypothetical protein